MSEQAASFGRQAAAYARGRPSYPSAAVDWLVPAAARRVLDLGAGTGKLTAELVDRGLDVVAVEPSAGMLDELRARVPGARAEQGSAEALPLADRSVDAALVAQAWHWVDPVRALPEVARVLVPGGTLGLVWNLRDQRTGWAAELGGLLAQLGEDQGGASGGWGPSGGEELPDLGGAFGPVEHTVVEWSHTTSRAEVLDLVTSRSYVITAPAARRDLLLREVGALLDSHPETAGREVVELPYRTHCYRATVREA